MTDCFYIYPIEETKAVWSLNEQDYSIDTGIKFESGSGLVSPVDGMIFIFRSENSFEAENVGKAFDFHGKCLFEIPFPEMKYRNNLKFWGAMKDGKDLRITFAPESGRDFWCKFDLETKSYIASHESR